MKGQEVFIMAKQELKSKTATKRTVEEVPVEETKTKTQTERGEELKQELDALLDEIDEVLESDAATFVKDYVQKGGE